MWCCFAVCGRLAGLAPNQGRPPSAAYLLVSGLLPVSSACCPMWCAQGISLCRCCCVRPGPACVLRAPAMRRSQACQAGVC